MIKLEDFHTLIGLDDIEFHIGVIQRLQDGRYLIAVEEGGIKMLYF